MSAEKERGPVAVTTEPPCNAVGAIAGSAYSKARATGNGPVSASNSQELGEVGRTAYHSRAARVWRYSGKRARVLAMLANMPGRVTQSDTLPWHTRLGVRIHVLRQGGLAIDTEREGEFRHAHYRLATPGSLLKQLENRGRL